MLLRMHTTPSRAVIYTRISKDRNASRNPDQRNPKEGAGVERQLKACRELAENLRWNVVATYSDNDISAYNGRRRPDFERMMAAIEAGEVDGLLLWHVDRLYRSMKDLEEIIETAETARLHIRTVKSGELDLATSAGKMVARILGSVARQESEHLGERRRLAYAQEAERGEWGANGHRPFGYTKQIKDPVTKQVLQTGGDPLEPEASMFRAAVQDVLEGKSLRQIARDWNASGVPTTLGTQWNSTRIRRILLSPRYAGIKTRGGKVQFDDETHEPVKADWTALIDQDTHYAVVDHLSKKEREIITKSGTQTVRVTNVNFGRRWLGSGVYVCKKCGGTMRVAYPGRSQGRKYQCAPHSCVMRTADAVDDYVTATVLERLSQPDAQVLIDIPDVDLPALQTERTKLVSKLDRLVSMHFDDKISDEQLASGSAKARKRINAIDATLAAAVRTSPAAALVAAASAGKLWEAWNDMTIDQRSQAVDELVTVTIQPLPRRGLRGFDEEFVDITWKREPA
jgi:DNA invertase Pin-like site-specific DNA recombinase